MGQIASFFSKMLFKEKKKEEKSVVIIHLPTSQSSCSHNISCILWLGLLNCHTNNWEIIILLLKEKRYQWTILQSMKSKPKLKTNIVSCYRHASQDMVIWHTTHSCSWSAVVRLHWHSFAKAKIVTMAPQVVYSCHGNTCTWNSVVTMEEEDVDVGGRTLTRFAAGCPQWVEDASLPVCYRTVISSFSLLQIAIVVAAYMHFE